MEWLLWAVSLILGVPAVLLDLGNWLVMVGAAVEAAWRGRSRTFSNVVKIVPNCLWGLTLAMAW